MCCLSMPAILSGGDVPGYAAAKVMSAHASNKGLGNHADGKASCDDVMDHHTGIWRRTWVLCKCT